MTTIQALLIAMLQGVTELFPVSSLGHAVIVPALLHWNLDERGLIFLPFLVMLHVGTAAALFTFFWRDWLALASGAAGLSDPIHVKESRHILLLIIVATVPAVVVGFSLERLLRALFGTPLIASVFLVLNGLILIYGDRLRSRMPKTAINTVARLNVTDAFLIGCWQCLAFLPGISRSGVTMTGALLRGISHEGAARFSFLIALPVILAATASQLFKLYKAQVPFAALEPALFGSIKAQKEYFSTRESMMRNMT